MKFLTLEDTQGTYEAALFPETYQRYGHLLTTHGPYLLTGQVQNDSNAYVLVVEHIEIVAQNGGRIDTGRTDKYDLAMGADGARIDGLSSRQLPEKASGKYLTRRRRNAAG